MVTVNFAEMKMHSDTYTSRYQPTSPLSPRMPPPTHISMSPPAGRSRTSHPKHNSHGFRLDLPNYPGISARSSAASPSPVVQSPAITLHRGAAPTPMESPRLMREKQKELIARAQLSSKLAASPLSAKPDAPRLDPLEGPKGPVTPLLLEEQAPDYFAVSGGGRFSPVGSPGARSSRSAGSSGSKEEKAKKKCKIDSF